MVKTPQSTFFWLVTIGAGACGVALAIAESSGFGHVRLVFSVASLLGLLWFILDAFIFPYRRLKVVGSGFSFVDHLNQSYGVQWSDVIGISVTRMDGALEWFIQTASGELICVMQDEFLYRHRLRHWAVEHLVGFDKAALRNALHSKADGTWECFKATPNPSLQPTRASSAGSVG